MYYSLEEVLNFKNNDLKYNYNYLEDINNKVIICWVYSSFDNRVQKEIDKTATGSMSMTVSEFKNEYYNLFNENISVEEIAKALSKYHNTTIQDNTIYGSYATGWNYDFALRTYDYNKKNDLIEISMYFITKFELDNNYKRINEETILNIKDNKNITIDKNLIFAKVKIKYEKDILKSIIIERV